MKTNADFFEVIQNILNKFIPNEKDIESLAKNNSRALSFQQEILDALNDYDSKKILIDFQTNIYISKPDNKMSFINFITQNHKIVGRKILESATNIIQNRINSQKQKAPNRGSNPNLLGANNSVIPGESSGAPEKPIADVQSNFADQHSIVSMNELDKIDLKYYISHSNDSKLLDQFLSIISAFGELQDSDKPCKPPMKYLAIQGGGAKGAAYPGVFEAMEATGDLASFDVVAGSSAGAMNALLLGLGLNSRQINAFGKLVNFQDFQDVSKTIGEEYSANPIVTVSNMVVTSGSFSGQNIHSWAQALLEFVSGHHDVTFFEFEQIVKKNPRMRNLVFKGFLTKDINSPDSPSREITFSSQETPNILILDAMSASKAFPGAFEAWKVREKIFDEKQNTYVLRVRYECKDGGITNNLPSDVYDQGGSYTHPNFPKVDKCINGKILNINPCSVSLSLCSTLSNLDETFHDLCASAREDLEKEPNKNTVKNEPEGIQENTITHQTKRIVTKFFYKCLEELRNLPISGNVSAIWRNKVGYARKEDLKEKLENHKGQVVQIYTCGVSTLEFKLSSTKQRKIEKSGQDSWMNYIAKNRNPESTYDGPTDFNLKIINNAEPENLKDSFVSTFKSYFLVFIKEYSRAQNHPDLVYRDLKKNQTLKHYAYQINNLKALYLNIIGTSNEACDINVLTKTALQSAFLECKKEESASIEFDQKIEILLETKKFIAYLKECILSKSREVNNPDKALRLYKGLLSQTLNTLIPDNENKTMLSYAVESGNVELTKAIINLLKENWVMLKQQGRRHKNSLKSLMNHPMQICIYESAFSCGNENTAKEMVDFLLSQVAPIDFSPLQTDFNGKNAFHYAIDRMNIDLLVKLVQWAVNNNIDIKEMSFGKSRDTLGHYLIGQLNFKKHQDFAKTLLNITGLLEHLVSSKAINRNGLTACLYSIQQYAKVHHSMQGQSSVQNMMEFERLRCEVASCGSVKSQQTIDKLVKGLNESITAQSRKINRTKELLTTLKSMTNNASENNAQLQDTINGMSVEQCYSVLMLDETDCEQYKPFIIESTQNSNLSNLTILLCKKISEATIEDNEYVNLLADFITNHRYEGKTFLYIASQNGSVELVTYLRGSNGLGKYNILGNRCNLDLEVNDSGPLDAPCALNAAAKEGHSAVVLAILESKPAIPTAKFIGTDLGYREISRSIVDSLGKTAMHHLARCGTPEGVYAFLNSFKSISTTAEYHAITDRLDSEGNSAFRCLVKNPHAVEIINYIMDNTPTEWKPSFIPNEYISSWKIYHFFNLNEKREDNLTDFDYAELQNKALYDKVSELMYGQAALLIEGPSPTFTPRYESHTPGEDAATAAEHVPTNSSPRLA